MKSHDESGMTLRSYECQGKGVRFGGAISIQQILCLDDMLGILDWAYVQSADE